MKKLLSVALSLLLAFTLTVPSLAALVGDIDNSGAVTAADARTALRIAVALDSADPGTARFTAADADRDGRITAADARLILRAAVGLETLPAWPSPKPSGDPLTSKEVYRLAKTYTFEINVDTAEYSAIGSGFAISENGLIVTNYHVVKDATVITVKDFDGKDYPFAEVVAFDRHYDLAILRVNAVLTPAVLDTTDYETGDTVYTLGSSNGLTGTFANGVISNRSRTLEDYNPDMHYIQTNAPISGGNSGGPLIDEYGRVIGVNTMSDESGQNLNFAVPAEYIGLLDRTHPLSLDEYIETEKNRRAFDLFIGPADVTLAPGGTASWVFALDSRKDATLTATSSSDKLKVTMTHGKNDEYGFLAVCALGEVTGAEITVYVKEAPEVKKTFTVDVKADAEKTYPSAGGAPDFGAVFGTAPASVTFMGDSSFPVMTYSGSALTRNGRSASDLRRIYEEALTKAGFTKSSESTALLGAYTILEYNNTKTGVVLRMTEHKRLGRLADVTIELP